VGIATLMRRQLAHHLGQEESEEEEEEGDGEGEE